MSALGQRRTCAVHYAMSALPPIATGKADIRNGHVCFTPESGHVQRNRSCLLWAKSGHLQTYSITSSARASRAGGTSRARARAVVRLMTNSNEVDCTTGRSEGLAPLRIWPV